MIEAHLPLAVGTDYTMIVTGLLANIAPAILTAAGGGPAPGNAWVRFFHGLPDAPAVDIALVGGPVLFSNVAFQQSAAYLEVPAGTYDREVRAAGTSTVALSLPGVPLADGGVCTADEAGLLVDFGKLSELYFVPTAARGEGFAGSFVEDRRRRSQWFEGKAWCSVPLAAAQSGQRPAGRVGSLYSGAWRGAARRGCPQRRLRDSATCGDLWRGPWRPRHSVFG